MDRALVHDALKRLYGAEANKAADFLYRFGSVKQALLFTELFVPDLVEVSGHVLLRSFKPQGIEGNFLAAVGQSSMPLAELVDSFNWTEIPYLFVAEEGVDEEYQLLAEVVAEAWHGRLKHLFPDRVFEVRVMSPDETGGAVGVGFRQIR